MWEPEVDTRSLLSHHLPNFGGQGFSVSLEFADLARLAGQQTRDPLSSLLRARITETGCCIADPNSATQSCVAKHFTY